MADSKFAQFIAERKLDGRRIMAASRQIERLLPEDRAIKLRKRLAKKAEGNEAGPKETRKPHSGRPVTNRALASRPRGEERQRSDEDAHIACGQPLARAKEARARRSAGPILEGRRLSVEPCAIPVASVLAYGK